MKPNYRIYPSLLDKFQDLLDYEKKAEESWNIVGEKGGYPGKDPGDYILTPGEMYDRLEQDLLDSINRVPHAPSLAADRGTALNEVVDARLLNRPVDREDMEVAPVTDSKGECIAISTRMNGATFVFDRALVDALTERLRGALCQYLVSAPLMTSHGPVELYGYLDYWKGAEVIDLKTTASYEFFNYEKKWQRYVYPYALETSGLATHIEAFTFLVVKLPKASSSSRVLVGGIYPETYTTLPVRDDRALTAHVEEFIAWLERHRNQITDKKIFNEL